jgi:site-specific recombinase XerD
MPRETFKKKVVTPELLERINPINIKLQKQFLKIKNTTSSDTTITNYGSDLDIFFCWNVENNNNKAFTDIKKIEFADFFSYATDELQWKSARFQRERATISSFSNFIEKYYDDEYPTFRNVILKSIESMPKNSIREKTILKESQIDSLKVHLESVEAWQDLCLLTLATGSGARINELLRFKTTDIDCDNVVFNGLFLRTCSQIKTKGRSKTGKMMYKYILKSEFLPYYEKWMIERAKIMEKSEQNHDYIFLAKDSTPATEGVVRGWTNRWGAFLNEDIYPHAFRHYTVTHLTRIGVEVPLIVEIIGWANSEMYAVYLDLAADEREWKGLDKLKDYFDKK